MSVEQRMWSFFKAKGLNDFGIAGLMGNLRAESGLNPKNLQNSYQNKIGHTDETYTISVDNGSYTNFVHDSAGYGLAQWTFWSRKQNLLNFAKSTGKSIGDLDMQMEFAYKELSEGYKTVLNALKNAKSVLDASNAVLLHYEKPADQSSAVQARRARYGQEYYDMFAGKEIEEDKKEELPTASKQLRFNIHAGHNPSGKIACGSFGYLVESDENRVICGLVIEKLRKLGHIVYDCTVNDGTSSSDVLQKIASKHAENEVDYNISIHFNAFKHEEISDGKTKGTEVWIYPNSTMRPLAQAVCDSIADLGLVNRGVKENEKFYVLRKIPNCMLIECLFVDDVDDVLLYNPEKMADAIVKGLTGNQVAEVPAVKEDEELYYVVVGAYRNKDNAERFAKHLNENGYIANDEGNLMKGIVTNIKKGISN